MNIFTLKLVDPNRTSEDGFTLVELLMAMLLLFLIIFAFTPLFVGSMERIKFAGEKSEALYESQSELEVDIAERNTIDGYELVFTYNNDDDVTVEPTVIVIKVPGGLVDAEVDKGEATAWLSGFVPYIPTISLSPSLLIEGYDNVDITVTGKFTDLGSADYIQINEETKHTIVENNVSADPDNNEETYQFKIEEGLVNSESPYIISTSWTVNNENVDDSIEITVRARLNIAMPYTVAVGESQNILVSPDTGTVWNNRYIETDLGTVKDIYWTGSSYIAVTSNGRTIHWGNLKEPLSSLTRSDALNSVSYANGNYVAVGDNGKMVFANSIDGFIKQNAETIDEANGGDLNSVIYGSNQFYAAGSNGLVLSSNDGIEWQDISPEAAENGEEGEVYNGMVSVGSKLYIVGGNSNGEAVILIWDGSDWSRLNPDGASTLNDIIYTGNSFIAVGNDGTIITSEDGSNWNFNLNNITSSDLYAIDYGYIGTDLVNYDYVIVGSGGVVLTSSGAQSWVSRSTGVSATLHGVAIRWIE